MERHGSMVMVPPSLKEGSSAMWRMCSWQVVERMGPWAWPLMTRPHWPQMPSRQSESKATGSLPSAKSCSLSRSRTSRKLMCSSIPVIEYSSK